MPKMQVSLLTGRTIDQGRGKEYGKLSDEYMSSVSICEIDPDGCIYMKNICSDKEAEKCLSSM